LANWQIAVLALYTLGGATSRQNGEDVAVKCFEIAPRRFGWEKYKEYPHLELARVALRDAKKEKYGVLVSGSEAQGWLLTADGRSWCEAHAGSFGVGESSRGWSALAEPEARALRQLRSHRIFNQWKRGDWAVAFYEIADALGFPADAPRPAVARRMEELAGAADVAGLSEVKDFVEWLGNEVASSTSK